ncbi:hypothetical protein AAVH_24854 [Aphelenchoides avenae]|nr:hypothetical protein AAVH_24854 [Aphelenchus avenae]
MRRQQQYTEDPPKPGTMPSMYVLSLEEPYKEVKTSCERCSPDAPCRTCKNRVTSAFSRFKPVAAHITVKALLKELKTELRELTTQVQIAYQRYWQMSETACGQGSMNHVSTEIEKKLAWLAAVDTLAANSNVSLDAPHDRQQSDSCKQCTDDFMCTQHRKRVKDQQASKECRERQIRSLQSDVETCRKLVHALIVKLGELRAVSGLSFAHARMRQGRQYMQIEPPASVSPPITVDYVTTLNDGAYGDDPAEFYSHLARQQQEYHGSYSQPGPTPVWNAPYCGSLSLKTEYCYQPEVPPTPCLPTYAYNESDYSYPNFAKPFLAAEPEQESGLRPLKYPCKEDRQSGGMAADTTNVIHQLH